MKVSIVTAAYNSESTIADTLRTINFQTYPDIEHIVVDGASRDGTLRVVEAEGKRLARVISGRDKGIYDAYNKGLALVTGEIIGFLNSDDLYCAPDVIERVALAFADPAVEAVYADLVYVDRDDISRIVRHWRSRPVDERTLRRGVVPAHPTLFVRKSVYDRYGLFDLGYRLAADFEFMYRIFYKHRVRSVYLPEILVKMRIGGATGESIASIRRQNDEILRAMRQYGVHVGLVNFFGHKIVDRIAQRVRARFVRLDEGVVGA